MSFGQRDNLLRGDDKISAALKSPITIYAGDVLEGGFNFVRVSFLIETTINNDQNIWTKSYCDLMRPGLIFSALDFLMIFFT